MFGIGFGEILLVLIVALLVIGPEHLPEITKTAGKLLAQLRKHSENFQTTFKQEFKQPLEQTVTDLTSLNSIKNPPNNPQKTTPKQENLTNKQHKNNLSNNLNPHE